MADQVDLVVQNEKISPATGKPLKKHEKSGLKFLKEEQEDKFWEEVAYWNEERFSEPNWKEELRRIGQVAQEHKLIEFGWHPPSPSTPKDSEPTSGGRQLLLQSSSSLTAPTGAHPLRPVHLPRIDSGSPTTARPRWDVVVSGPITPLSATAGPIKNAFAEGGFWASLTPKTSSLASDSVPATPMTAIPPERVPSPPIDLEARAAYDSVNQDVTAMALQLCASRLALRRSPCVEYDVIHPSMVKPRDSRLAAEFTLSTLPCPPFSLNSASLPEKLHRFGEEELKVLRQYSIPSMEHLRELDTWLLLDYDTASVGTILEVQREAVHMNRYRRKEKEVAIDEQAVRLAWAVKILEDKENLRGGEDSDEDEGYEYGNIMRSLEIETNTTTDPKDGNNGVRIRNAQRSASSPIKPTPGTLPLALRSRQASHTFSNSPRPAHRYPTSSGSLARSYATKNRPAHLSINTTTLETRPEQALSPQDRIVRHIGPSIEDLSSWANELKLMERKRTEMKLAGRWNAGGDAFSRQQRFRGSMGEAAVVGGCSLHPAFRSWHDHHDNGDGEDETEENETSSGSSGSTKSWVCKTAKTIERNACALHQWEQGQKNGDDDEDEDEDDDKTLTSLCSTPTQQRPQSPSSSHTIDLSPPQPHPYNRLAPTSYQRRFASLPSRTLRHQDHTTSPHNLQQNMINPSSPRTIRKCNDDFHFNSHRS